MISYVASILFASSRPDSIIFLTSASSSAQSTVPPIPRCGPHRRARSNSSSSGSKALPLADLPSTADSPSRQYLATVCRSMPCLLAISLKFGFAPDPPCRRSALPLRFAPYPAPPGSDTRSEHSSVSAVGESALAGSAKAR